MTVPAVLAAAMALVATVPIPEQTPAPTQPPQWAAVRYGDWVAQLHADGSEAGTVNDKDQGFGFVCSGDCFHYVDLRTACTDGTRYSGTATIGEQRFSLAFTCHVVEALHVFVADIDFDYLQALPKGTAVSIAIGEPSGTVLRGDFSLRGCAEAVAFAAESAAQAATPIPKP